VHGVVGGEAAAVDVLEHLRIARASGPVENQQAVTETDDAIGVSSGEVEEVQVDDGGDTEIAADLLEIAHHDVAGRWVERRYGLVGEHDRRLLCQRPGDAHALALWSTRFGNPNPFTRGVLRSFNNVIRSIPDLLWALLFVSAVGIGALPGLLALFFFSLAVTTKLTSDTLDGIDMGPIEAANATGANTSQMLRTAVVPQILPAYSSFVLYNFELNLRASAVLGLVGAGGIGNRIQFFRGRGEWEELWGLVFMFFLVVFFVERLSVTLRRRLI
jgi:ABC-type proline/glycine betaine transport system permease subunit